jgi:hypothetical protein
VHVATSKPSREGDGYGAVRNVVSLDPSPAGWRGRCHRVRGDTGALEVNLEPWDTWRHRNPLLTGGVPDATGHVAKPGLSGTGSGSGAAETCGGTAALPCRVRNLVSWGWT